MPSPIEIMINQSGLRCTKCSAPAGTCQCWERCRCGHSFERGKACRNPTHEIEKCAKELADGVAGNVIVEIRHLYPEPMRHASGGFSKTLKAIIQKQVMETLMVVYEENDKAEQANAGSVR